MDKDLRYYLSLPYKIVITPDIEEGISMNQYCLYLLAKNDAVNHISN